MAIKIIIVDDHPVVLQGLQHILKQHSHIELLGTCTDGTGLHNLLSQRQPDVILMDIQLPVMNGFDLTKEIKKKYPKIAILVLTNMSLTYQVRRIMKDGASGYLLKSASPGTLTEAIEAVAKGILYIDKDLKDQLLKEDFEKDAPELILSVREKEILSLIAKEMTTSQIAKRLFISQRTVDNHRFNMLTKMGVKNTAGLIKKALALGLIE